MGLKTLRCQVGIEEVCDCAAWSENLANELCLKHSETYLTNITCCIYSSENAL